MLSCTIFWVFTACLVINCGYAVFFFRRIFRIKGLSRTEENRNRKPVSVIICARNEAFNLVQNLPAVLKQNYSNKEGNTFFEVIVVNDHSTDDTTVVLQRLSREYPQLRIVELGAGGARPGKKGALCAGVDAALNDFLLFTDADCMPAGPQWLALMAEPLHMGKEIVAGYSGYYPAAGLLNIFIRWETVHSFLQYTTYCLAGIPYMAVGRNLACTKGAFRKASRSGVWNKLPSGDDDLLVSEVATGDNMEIMMMPATFTMSAPVTGWSAYWAQKQRHLSTGKYYKPLPKLLLGVYGGSHAATWLGFVGALCTPYYLYALALMYVRCLMHWSCWYNACNRVGERRLVMFFPFMDFAWMLYNFALSPYVFFKNKKTWK